MVIVFDCSGYPTPSENGSMLSTKLTEDGLKLLSMSFADPLGGKFWPTTAPHFMSTPGGHGLSAPPSSLTDNFSTHGYRSCT